MKSSRMGSIALVVLAAGVSLVGCVSSDTGADLVDEPQP